MHVEARRILTELAAEIGDVARHVRGDIVQRRGESFAGIVGADLPVEIVSLRLQALLLGLEARHFSVRHEIFEEQADPPDHPGGGVVAVPHLGDDLVRGYGRR